MVSLAELLGPDCRNDNLEADEADDADMDA